MTVNTTFKCVMVRANVDANSSILIATLYRPPGYDVKFNNQFNYFMLNLLSLSECILVHGDFY